MTDPADDARGLSTLTAEPGWVAVQPFPSVDTRNTFVSGDPTGERLRVAYFRRERDGVLVGKVWFGPGTEGPPGCAHGGSVASVLDEAMGAAAWLASHPVIAARLVVDFRELVALGSDARFEAWVDRVEGRKVTTRARLVGPDDRLLAEAEGLFVLLQPEQQEVFAARAARRHSS